MALFGCSERAALLSKSMRRHLALYGTALFFVAGLFVQAPSRALAFDAVDVRLLLRTLASSKLQPQASAKALGIYLTLPSYWELKHEASKGRFFFSDPLARSVLGAVFYDAEQLGQMTTVEEAIATLAALFTAELSLQSSEAYQNALGTKGTRALLQGRLKGEESRFLFFWGESAQGKPLLFFVEAPALWYASYAHFFEDILSSLGDLKGESP